ncbi:DoxX-like family protein [Saccharospirillum alexandrii]|uniref:DoxX-like family protein n=1 Tax=Saccharospirillum alexandrii TaxID=2448477 RepID=UPI0037362B15
MNNTYFSYAVCRVTIAVVWLYQGLVPKLLYMHEDELAMSMAAGFSHSEAVNVATIGGVLEVGMAVMVLIFWRQRWPLYLTAIAMLGLLFFVILVQPTLLVAAFNPVTTNITVLALSIVGLQLHHR